MNETENEIFKISTPQMFNAKVNLIQFLPVGSMREQKIEIRVQCHKTLYRMFVIS